MVVLNMVMLAEGSPETPNLAEIVAVVALNNCSKVNILDFPVLGLNWDPPFR